MPQPNRNPKFQIEREDYSNRCGGGGGHGIGTGAPSSTREIGRGFEIGGLIRRANRLEIVAGHDLLLLINPILVDTADLMRVAVMMVDLLFLLLRMIHQVDEVLALRRNRSLRQIHYLFVHVRRRIHRLPHRLTKSDQFRCFRFFFFFFFFFGWVWGLTGKPNDEDNLCLFLIFFSVPSSRRKFDLFFYYYYVFLDRVGVDIMTLFIYF
jgi:hypothetical protein